MPVTQTAVVAIWNLVAGAQGAFLTPHELPARGCAKDRPKQRDAFARHRPLPGNLHFRSGRVDTGRHPTVAAERHPRCRVQLRKPPFAMGLAAASRSAA